MIIINTALEIQDFNFYGDNLVAIKDNTTQEIYTPITQILKGIGFNEKQTEHQKNKMITDIIIQKGTQKFLGVDLNLPSVNEIWCISNRKLPLALAKINITPKMKKTQPELSSKLELYQDKCADILTSVFIDKNNINYTLLANSISSIINNTLKPISDRLSNIEEKQNQQEIIQPKKNKMSSWTRKMFPKYKLLMEYFNISRIELYHNLYIELENSNPDIDITQLQEDYCYENGLETCFALDAIEHNKTIRDSFENMVNNLLIKYHLTDDITKQEYKPTIFDDDYDYIGK